LDWSARSSCGSFAALANPDQEQKMTLFKQPVKNSVSEKKKGDG
jgi:hypothetical protein